MLYTLSGAPLEAFSKFPMPRNTKVFAPTFKGEGIVRSNDITKDPRYGKNPPRQGLSIFLTWSLTLMKFGADPDATVRAGFVTKSGIMIAIIVSAVLSGGLSYRSALVMRELALARAELLRISCTDQLCGLLNRRGFDEAAMSALTKAREANLPITVLMCDIDRFKAINDQFGHEFGDKVIVAIAEVLRSFSERRQMLVARHGGQEFAVLMTGVSKEKAARYAEELRQACAAQEILGEKISACVPISIGLARMPRRNEPGQGHADGRSGPLRSQTSRTQSRRAGGRPDRLDRGLGSESQQLPPAMST
jgi:diguanylate cyclase (GGDEF)-like protein